MGGYCAYYEQSISLMRLKFGTEMGFEPGKTSLIFGMGAPIPFCRGGQRVGQKVHCLMLLQAP